MKRPLENRSPQSPRIKTLTPFVWFALEPAYAFCSHDMSNAFAQEYPSYLLGRRIEKAEVHLGGYSSYTFVYFGERALMFQSVAALYHAAGAKRPKRHQLLLELDDGSALSFCGSLGGPLFLFEVDADGCAKNYTNPFSLLVSEDFSLDYFLALVRETEFRKMSVKEFLATKNRIPGFDNSILHEVLWEARIHPKTKMACLGEAEYVRIYHSIKTVFAAVIAGGGKDTDKDLFGNPGRYVTHVSKNTLGQPCTRCGESVVKEAFLGGAVYYCPRCQPLVTNA